VPVAWRNFAHDCSANARIEEELRGLQHDRCTLCGVYLASHWEIHHISYMRRCRHSRVVDCHNCAVEAPEEFSECVKRLRMLHPNCHEQVHGIDPDDPERQSREKGWIERRLMRVVVSGVEDGTIATRVDAISELEGAGWTATHLTAERVTLRDPITGRELTFEGWPLRRARD
jgi:hypothetical protein